MNSPATKEAWKLLHADQDLDRFVEKASEWDEPYPEPIILEM